MRNYQLTRYDELLFYNLKLLVFYFSFLPVGLLLNNCIRPDIFQLSFFFINIFVIPWYLFFVNRKILEDFKTPYSIVIASMLSISILLSFSIWLMVQIVYPTADFDSIAELIYLYVSSIPLVIILAVGLFRGIYHKLIKKEKGHYELCKNEIFSSVWFIYSAPCMAITICGGLVIISQLIYNTADYFHQLIPLVFFLLELAILLIAEPIFLFFSNSVICKRGIISISSAFIGTFISASTSLGLVMLTWYLYCKFPKVYDEYEPYVLIALNLFLVLTALSWLLIYMRTRWRSHRECT